MKYRVIKNYTDTPLDPIIVSRGERLNMIKESNPQGDWPNWIFCQGNNKSGWIPKQILQIEDKKVTILEDYSAVEHNLKVYEVLVADYQLNGWIWCYKEGDSQKKYAWSPLNHLLQVK